MGEWFSQRSAKPRISVRFRFKPLTFKNLSDMYLYDKNGNIVGEVEIMTDRVILLENNTERLYAKEIFEKKLEMLDFPVIEKYMRETNWVWYFGAGPDPERVPTIPEMKNFVNNLFEECLETILSGKSKESYRSSGGFEVVLYKVDENKPLNYKLSEYQDNIQIEIKFIISQTY